MTRADRSLKKERDLLYCKGDLFKINSFIQILDVEMKVNLRVAMAFQLVDQQVLYQRLLEDLLPV